MKALIGLLFVVAACGGDPNIGGTCTAQGGCDDELTCDVRVPGGYCTMACATPGGNIEGAYLAALAHVERSAVDMRKPQQLQLILDNGDTLVFARRGQ